jgi:DNA-directed RNA polymerase specialized sigma24 family protein
MPNIDEQSLEFKSCNADASTTAPLAPEVAAAAVEKPERTNGAAHSNARSWKTFADLINGAWSKTVEAILESSRYVLEAQNELPRGEFEAMLRLELAFDASVGRKLVRIAKNEVLSCAPGHKLPPSWTILYELSKLDDDVLKAAIADGRVNPKMSRKDAIALRRPSEEDDNAGENSEPPSSPPSSDPVAVAVEAIDALKPEQLRDCLDRISSDHQRAFKHHFADGKSDAAVLAEISQNASECTALLAHPKQHIDEIHKKLARIKRLTGHDKKSRRKAPKPSSNVELDVGAFGRGMTPPGPVKHKFTMPPNGVDGSENPSYALPERADRSKVH